MLNETSNYGQTEEYDFYIKAEKAITDETRYMKEKVEKEIDRLYFRAQWKVYSLYRDKPFTLVLEKYERRIVDNRVKAYGQFTVYIDGACVNAFDFLIDIGVDINGLLH